MKRIITLSLMIMFSGIFISVKAQNLSDIPGSFVDVGFGTRPVAMGFAYVGLADDENSPYWNPAGLSQISEYKAGFAQIDQLGLITYNYATAIVPLPFENHAAGLTVISSGDDAMRELSVHAAYGLRFKFVSIGAGLKYRNASFGNNTLNRDDYIVFDDSEINVGLGQQVFGDASGFGFDLGLLFHPSKTIKFGVMMRDAFAPMSWNSEARSTEYQARGTYDEDLPMEVVFGSSAIINENFLVVADYQPALTDERTHFVRVGLEGRLVNILMLRAGTEQGVNDLDDERYTLGTGLDIIIQDKLRLQTDFAYVIDPIQNSTRISFTVSF